MRSVVIVIAEPGFQCLPRLFEAVEVVEPQALLLYGSDQSLDHAILLRRVRTNEFLPNSVSIHGLRVSPTAEHQAIIRTDGEVVLGTTQDAIATDQGFL